MADLQFHLEGIVKDKSEISDFEGPLSVILMLLSKNKVEIRDIIISDICGQYLSYLDEVKAMDLEIASEFVQMASYLIYVKTKALVTAKEELTELQELIISLEAQKNKELAESIREILPTLFGASETGMLLHTRQQEKLADENNEYRYKHNISELLLNLYSVFSRDDAVPPPPTSDDLRKLAPQRIVYGVKDKSREIIETLKRVGSIRLFDLYSSAQSRSELVATFISVLELCAAGSLEIDTQCDDMYNIRFIGGDTEKILESVED